MVDFKKIAEQLRKDKKGQTLSTKQWQPNPGDQMIGQIITRDVITRDKDGKRFDKIVVKTNDGVYETILREGILALAENPVGKGDLLVVTYNGLVPIGKSGHTMNDATVEVFPSDLLDGLPF